jgi:hypothetical protein
MNLEGEFRNGGQYDPVKYRDWGYCKSARNPCENDPTHGEPRRGIEKRPRRPMFLCFLDDNTTERYIVRPTEKNNPVDFLFVSYTAVQFPPSRQRQLVDMVINAAIDAKLGAFWIDFECVEGKRAVYPNGTVRPTANSTEFRKMTQLEAYRICDIVRACHSLQVFIGPLDENQIARYSESDIDMWLRGWSKRMWVLPELLLAPSEAGFLVHASTSNNSTFNNSTLIKKRNLAQRACDDADEVAQLIDHYEGSIHLSQLEFTELALSCLSHREYNPWHEGNTDLAYGLRGLLRNRPEYREGEEGFEIFASLSLAHDSAQLLERLICLLPQNPEASWSDMSDGWLCKPWDVEPKCQVAGIVDDNTVLLDQTVGASIAWDRLETVGFSKRNTVWRLVLKFGTRLLPVYFILAVTLIAVNPHLYLNLRSASSVNPLTGQVTHIYGPKIVNTSFVMGLIFLLLTLSVILTLPYWLKKLYQGKFYSTQALFFGIDGIPKNKDGDPDLAEIERRLFGFDQSRLKWSTNGSLLSKHTPNEHHECEALPPAQENIGNIDTKQLIESGQRLFTLIDTFSMTATPFYAYRPPSTVFLCGQEGGMARGVLCSYNWRNQTFYRETVIRMKSQVRDRMSTVDRFRFALRRAL